MTLASGKVIIVAAILFVALGWAISESLVRWEKTDYACLKSKWWYGVGDKQQWFGIGRLHFYYQPLAFGCDEAHRYDPKQYKVVNGLLSPLEH